MEQHNINNTEQLNQVPHVRQVSLHMDALKAFILQRLEWSDEQYNVFQMEAGFEFLTMMMGDSHKDKHAIACSPLFWGWWRNEWYVRDQSFYKYKTLTADEYEYLNTNDVASCGDTRTKFWGHVTEFKKAGEAKLKKEVE